MWLFIRFRFFWFFWFYFFRFIFTAMCISCCGITIFKIQTTINWSTWRGFRYYHSSFKFLKYNIRPPLLNWKPSRSSASLTVFKQLFNPLSLVPGCWITGWVMKFGLTFFMFNIYNNFQYFGKISRFLYLMIL